MPTHPGGKRSPNGTPGPTNTSCPGGDGQQELLNAVCERLRAREGVASRFFSMNNTYLFIGEYKYWLMTDYNEIDPYNDEGGYVLNRARLYRDRRDFVIQPGDTGRPEDYPVSPAHAAGG